MHIRKFLYEFLFVNQTTGKLSHTKFLSIASGLVMLGLFVYVNINKIEVNVELWLVYASTMLGSHHLTRFLEYKKATAAKSEQA